MRRIFTRRNGEKLTIHIEVDMEKLAEDLARKIARQGAKRITKSGGAIIATVVE